MAQNSTNTAFYRDIRFLKVLFQILFLLGVAALAGFFYANMIKGLSDQGHPLSLSFLDNEAGFEISEGIDFEASDSYLKAFWVGVVNTLRVSILGIVCATVLGFIFGVARLSTNWLIRSIAAVYVEIFRNVPLLLQILFWYAITQTLPRIAESISFIDTIFINVRGIYLPTIAVSDGFSSWLWYLLSGVGLAIIIVFCFAVFRLLFGSKEVQQTYRSAFVSNTIFGAKWFAAPVFLIVAIAGWFLSPGQPLQITNVSGIFLPTIAVSDGFSSWLWYLLAGVGLAIIFVICFAVFRLLFGSKEVQQTDRSSFVSNTIFGAKWFAAPVFLIVAIAGWFLSQGQPLQIIRPEIQGFNFVGGINFTPEFLALLVGLAVYTSAYIAEVVRSGIQAVVKGQREAARSVGLNQVQELILVVIPQAIPIIVPPLTSQYLNLAKNSSLAIAIGFLDLFHVGRRMIAQTGQTIPIFGMIMVSYLIMSLTTSALMNWYNRRITRYGR